MDPSDIETRLEDLLREVRRQGRASVAAQAASESCLEAVNGLRKDFEGFKEGDDDGDGTSGEQLLRALLPVFDAIDRVAQQAKTARAKAPAPWIQKLLSPPPDDVTLGLLADGLRLLRAQLEAALNSVGVEVDRRVGVIVDAERHRVVEVRRNAPGPRETVLEIVRPGYSFEGIRIRETDVVVKES
jgi:molecular chaperone GrpE (heat shock protein)